MRTSTARCSGAVLFCSTNNLGNCVFLCHNCRWNVLLFAISVIFILLHSSVSSRRVRSRLHVHVSLALHGLFLLLGGLVRLGLALAVNVHLTGSIHLNEKRKMRKQNTTREEPHRGAVSRLGTASHNGERRKSARRCDRRRRRRRGPAAGCGQPRHRERRLKGKKGKRKKKERGRKEMYTGEEGPCRRPGEGTGPEEDSQREDSPEEDSRAEQEGSPEEGSPGEEDLHKRKRGRGRAKEGKKMKKEVRQNCQKTHSCSCWEEGKPLCTRPSRLHKKMTFWQNSAKNGRAVGGALGVAAGLYLEERDTRLGLGVLGLLGDRQHGENGEKRKSPFVRVHGVFVALLSCSGLFVRFFPSFFFFAALRLWSLLWTCWSSVFRCGLLTSFWILLTRWLFCPSTALPTRCCLSTGARWLWRVASSTLPPSWASTSDSWPGSAASPRQTRARPARTGATGGDHQAARAETARRAERACVAPAEAAVRLAEIMREMGAPEEERMRVLREAAALAAEEETRRSSKEPQRP